MDASKPSSRKITSTAPARATATPFDDIPFAGLEDGFPATAQGLARPLQYTQPWEYIVSNSRTASVEDSPQRLRMTKDAVTGEFSETLSVFRACLQIGELERAQILLKRMPRYDRMTPEVLIELSNEYLKAAVEQLSWKPSGTANQALHKWFELEVHSKGLPVDLDTMGYVLKAALKIAEVDQRHRLVQRYMGISKHHDFGLEVLSLDIMTAEELNEIIHICPEYTAGYEMELEAQETLESQEEDVEQHIATSSATNLESQQPSIDVKPMQQKGLGLKSLKAVLSLLDSKIGVKGLGEEEQREVQRNLEAGAISAALERWREENNNLRKMGLDSVLQSKSLGARMWQWSESLAAEIDVIKDQSKAAEEKQNGTRTLPESERCIYGPFLRMLSSERLAAATIISVMGTISLMGASRGVPLASTIDNVAYSVEDEVLFDVIHQKNQKAAWSQHMSARKKQLTTSSQLKRVKRACGKAPLQRLDGTYNEKGNMAPSGDTSTPGIGYSGDNAIQQALTDNRWPVGIRIKIGAVLVEALIKIATIPATLEHRDTRDLVTQIQPAFAHAYTLKKGKKIGVITANKALRRVLEREPVHTLLAKHLPMLVKPDPWSDFGRGGFLSHSVDMMRVKNGDRDQKYYVEAAIGHGDMTQTFRGLDVLGKTAWNINGPVFDVMLEAWNTGEQIANLAPEHPQLEHIPEPDTKNLDPYERRKWIRAVKETEDIRSGLHSQRCFQNFQLEIARSLKNETFYFPHNVDFRGRAYPIPPYLNHIGADHCRGLLTFAKGKELGKAGLRWLKIHLSNVFGYDKASLDEREAFASQHLDQIYETATNPLGGSRWFLTAEDPWQFLAACIELKNALESPDPEKFVSKLPVHQDGTCNGLQHYAALGGDEWGAAQVNLVPGERPADVYTAVANLVKASIGDDLKDGNAFAAALEGKITRKIVKQTVMTNVYGVTYIGAKAQVKKALLAAYDDLPHTPTVYPGILAGYIATKIFTALATMFGGAHDIQYWLGECASRISTSVTPAQMDRWASYAKSGNFAEHEVPSLADTADYKTSVIWTNPLHMPVVQPYRKLSGRVVRTNMQEFTLVEPHRSSPVNKRKQLQAFPPNFIHSLDASHMILSALACDDKGLTFAAVHDSFWTHAGDVDTMNGVLREAFIRIHEEDVVGRLSNEFKTRYQGHMTMVKIASKKEIHEKITKIRAEMFRGKVKGKRPGQLPIRIMELNIERERCRLLASSDPQEVEQGRLMITPASVWEAEYGDHKNFTETASEYLENKNALVLKQAATLGSLPSASERSWSPKVASHEGKQLESEDLTENADFDSDNEDVDLDEVVYDRNMSRFEYEGGVIPKTQIQESFTWVWRPVTFPPVPKKVCRSRITLIYRRYTDSRLGCLRCHQNQG